MNLRLVRECAVVMSSDPDPYFLGEYDWYSTGCNLALMNDNLLFHVQTNAGQMNQLSNFVFKFIFILNNYLFYLFSRVVDYQPTKRNLSN